jgi:hypothetical protein
MPSVAFEVYHDIARTKLRDAKDVISLMRLGASKPVWPSFEPSQIVCGSEFYYIFHPFHGMNPPNTCIAACNGGLHGFGTATTGSLIFGCHTVGHN